MVTLKTPRQTSPRFRQAKRKRRIFTDTYKANIMKTLASLIETSPDKIGAFLKKEGLTWRGVQYWQEQVNKEGPTLGHSPTETGGVPEVPKTEKISGTDSGGVRNMRVPRVGKYKNVTLDSLYTENLRLKERIAELEQGRKNVKLIIELDSKVLQEMEVPFS